MQVIDVYLRNGDCVSFPRAAMIKEEAQGLAFKYETNDGTKGTAAFYVANIAGYDVMEVKDDE